MFHSGDRKTSLLLFLVLSAMLAGSCVTVKPQASEAPNSKAAVTEKIHGKFSFVVLGDNRSGDEVYQKLLKMAVSRNPDFMVNTGDQIASPGNLQDWVKFWRMSEVVTVPYFLTVGNHDVNPMVPTSEKIYAEQVDLPGNELYYSFVTDNSLFIVLDSCRLDSVKKITGEQLTWLEGVLAHTDKQHKFVFLHHPLFTEEGKGRHSGDGLDKYPAERDRLEALLEQYRVDAVFSGHEHLYRRSSVGGITHVITGGGGAPLYANEEDGGFYHFVWVTVDADKVSAEVVDINGNIRDNF